ncbi:MAG: hybrid sensor histidine kinase/response regulator [Bacteroidetes bacterium 47-18]|nr:MAG: hybrid sensor histidine kinase/response regulator [Bacteroidetes bacterium 47-18]
MIMPEKIKILYIDDEPHNLLGFKAAFRMDYDLFTSLDTTEARQILSEHPDIRIIFCDQRMPGKTGVEFFDEIRREFPLPVRILITAYTDVEAVIDAINKGNIFRYIKKPWSNVDIMSSIEEANKFYMAISMLSIKNEELQKAYKELDKFAYSVSHDIRGPIIGLITAINFARDLDDITEIKDLLTLMEKSVKKLDTFILNMHDYYNVQRGDLKISRIDFEKIASDQKDIYSTFSLAGKIPLYVDVQQSPHPFYSDEMSLKLILTNLLSNAIKFQRQDAKEKWVKLTIITDADKAVITVSDNGIGIPEDEINEIFGLFYRSSSKEAGFGFGLYNLKSALTKLNGTIDVTSRFGEGTTFTVTVPTIYTIAQDNADQESSFWRSRNSS